MGSSCNMWDLVSQPRIEPGRLALGEWSFSHWTTRKVLAMHYLLDFLDKLGSLFWFLLELSHEQWVSQGLGFSGLTGQLRWLDLPVFPCGLSSQVFSLNSSLRTAFQEEEGEVPRFLEAWTLERAHVVFITFYWPYLVPRSIQGKRNRFHLSMEKAAKN